MHKVCDNYRYQTPTDGEQVRKFDDAVRRGDLLWADSPMNLDPGVAGPTAEKPTPFRATLRAGFLAVQNCFMWTGRIGLEGGNNSMRRVYSRRNWCQNQYMYFKHS